MRTGLFVSAARFSFRFAFRFALVVVGLVAVAAVARAKTRDFVVEHSGVGGTAEQAAPYLDQFLRYAEQALGWPAGSATGKFFPDGKEATEYIAKERPGFGMVDPELWLELQGKKDLGEVVILSTISGKNQTIGHYSVVVKDPAFKALSDLKGKRLISNHLQSPKFLSRVAFDGTLDVTTHFKLMPTASPLKGLKSVDRGEAEATLLDDDQLEHMKTLPFGASLRVIYTSPSLPPMPVVAFGKSTTEAERAAFAKMLFGMCSDKKGAEVCKALQISSFAPPNQAAYQDAIHRFQK